MFGDLKTLLAYYQQHDINCYLGMCSANFNDVFEFFSFFLKSIMYLIESW